MSITRRSVLKGGLAAGAVAVTAPFERAVSAQTIRTRYNVNSPQGQANLKKYEKAVGIMMNTSTFPRTDARSWTWQWYTHWIPGPAYPWSAAMQTKTNMLNTVFGSIPPTDPRRQLATAMWDDCQAHNSNPADPNFFLEMFFCVWHRWYVYYFEDIIRGVLNDQTFTLPYWNYVSGNVADLSIPAAFRNTSSPLYRANRNAWVNAGQRIDQQNPGSLNLNCLNQTVYINTPDGSIGFCPAIDQNPHGLVHVYVGNGTNMGSVPTAAGDPIFWLHHANIDRIWESWNRIPGRSNPPWPNRAFPFANRQGNAVTAQPSGANRVSLLRYQYDAYATTRRVFTRATTLALAVASQDASVTRAQAPERVALGTARTQVALQPPMHTQLASQPMLADPAPSKGMQLVLGDVTAPEGTGSTYNVFLNLPDGAEATPANPAYVGTIHFFGAHDEGGHGRRGHSFTFDVTERVQALARAGQRSAAPMVTLVRHGDAESGRPQIGHVVLTEQ